MHPSPHRRLGSCCGPLLVDAWTTRGFSRVGESMSIRQRLLAKGGASALALALAAAGLFMAAPAKAALLLSYNGGPTITDNGAGDLDPSVGTINNTSNIGGFGVSITIAESNSPGTSTAGLLQISNLSIENQTSGT